MMAKCSLIPPGFFAIDSAIFLFFVGMPAAYFHSKNGDPLDTTQRAESAAARAHFTFGDCIPLRADL